MHKTLCVVFHGLSTVGCVSTNQIRVTRETTNGFNNKEVTTTARSKPDFCVGEFKANVLQL
jgi:hypothetical protein